MRLVIRPGSGDYLLPGQPQSDDRVITMLRKWFPVTNYAPPQ